VTLGTQVKQVQEDAAKLIVAYSGDKARDISDHEAEVVNAWRNLQIMVEHRKNKLVDTSDLYRFFNMVRDLMLWMEDILRQMATQEKPRDVSGVELLMNNHQSLRAEVDAREENFAICINLGKDLLTRRHYRSQEVRDKLIQLGTRRGDMMETWEERWEYLQLILEVYQFARDAAVAETWLAAHEPYLSSHDFGETLDAVENLIKKHEAFEKSAATQEERFAALERLTTFELKEREKFKQEEYRRQHPDSPVPVRTSIRQKYIEEFLPPPEPEPEPKPVKKEEIQVAASVEARAGAAGEPSQPLVNGEKEPEDAPVEAPGRGAGEAEHHEGILVRKHEWESINKKASNRSWDKLYVTLSGPSLAFYKDQKHAKSDPNGYYHGEQPIDLNGASCAIASDYTKRPHVFRLKLSNGGDYLFQCKDDDEMMTWIHSVSAASGAESGSPTRAQTLPAQSGDRKDEHKRRSFFTLGKRK